MKELTDRQRDQLRRRCRRLLKLHLQKGQRLHVGHNGMRIIRLCWLIEHGAKDVKKELLEVVQ